MIASQKVLSDDCVCLFYLFFWKPKQKKDIPKKQNKTKQKHRKLQVITKQWNT